MEKYAIILAAGKGSRMNSDIPKCAIDFFGKTIIERIVDACLENEFQEIIVVIGYKGEIIKNILGNKVTYVYQEEQLGTAHAVWCCDEKLKNKDGICVIIPGDMPLIDSRTIFKLMKVHLNNESYFTFVSTYLEEDNQYGRIVRDEGYIKRIVEYKDASEEERKIKEVNSGLYCVNIKQLFKELRNISCKNLSYEFYLTDLVEIFEKKYKVGCYFFDDYSRLIGVNDQNNLNKAKEIYKKMSNN